MNGRVEPGPDGGRRSAIAGSLGPSAAAWLPGGAGAQDRGIVGCLAPELEIDHWHDADGEPTTFSLAASRGRWTFLKCFQSWCPSCHSSGFPTLVAVQEAFGADGKVAMATIQTVFEGHGTNREDRIPLIRKRYGLEMPIGHDPGDPDALDERLLPGTMRRYRTGGTPWLVLIDPAGRVVFDGFHVDADQLIGFLTERTA